MQTITKCVNCRHESITYDPFMAPSLQVKPDLPECLQHYFNEKALDDD